MGTSRSSDDVATLIAVGAAVAICASLAHEALGHGVGCLAEGGTITLLTFLVFRCAGAGVLADGGGPAGALIVACACLGAVARLKPKPGVASLFAYAMGVHTAFWICAQTVREGLDGSDDWGHVARDLYWPAGWQVAAVCAGIVGYAATIRIAAVLGRPLAQGRPARLLIPYASTCAFAVLFGALWHGDRVASALDGFLSFGVAPLGYLWSIRAASRGAWPEPVPIDRNRGCLACVAVTVCIFALTIAQGVGRLA